MNRQQRRAARRRSAAGESGSDFLKVSFDHIWPGSEEKARQAHPGVRGDQIWEALQLVFEEIAAGKSNCAGCGTPLHTADAIGECTIAHIWEFRDGKPLAIGIPFCRRCASSPEAVTALAKQAVARTTGVEFVRLQ